MRFRRIEEGVSAPASTDSDSGSYLSDPLERAQLDLLAETLLT